MSYEWITPKTDWVKTDQFTYQDYNRIRNNLLYINDKLNTNYPSKKIILDLGDDKTGYNNDYYASEFVAFENALDSFTRVGRNVNVGAKSNFKGNESFADADALNRIEKSCLRWKDFTKPQYKIFNTPYEVRNGACAVEGYDGGDRTVHVMGGGGGFTGVTEHWCFNTRTETWKKCTDLPRPFFAFAAANLWEEMFIAGGSTSNLEGRSDVYYNSNRGREYPWKTIPNLPVGLYGLHLVPYRYKRDIGLLCLGGGSYVGDALNGKRAFFIQDNFISMIGNWQRLQDLPFVLDDKGSVSFFSWQKIYANSSDKLYRLTVKNKVDEEDVWEELCLLPHASEGGKIISSNTSIYYIGGSSKDLNYYKLDEENMTWEAAGELPWVFRYGTVVCVDNNAYVIGGTDSVGKNKMCVIPLE